jgi:hypothetical protein
MQHIFFFKVNTNNKQNVSSNILVSGAVLHALSFSNLTTTSSRLEDRRVDMVTLNV